MSNAAARAALFGDTTGAKKNPPPAASSNNKTAAAATGAASDLPPDWVEKMDEAKKKPYWYNKKTRETTWKKPEAAASAAATESKWVEKKDEKSGKPYWYHKETRETTWKKPAELVAAEEKKTTSAAAGGGGGDDELLPGWKEVKDPKSGKTYYVNGKETTWTKPVKKKEEKAAAADDDELLPGWKEVKDPKSGKTYYVNSSTKETTWTKPVKKKEEEPAATAAAAEPVETGPPKSVEEALRRGLWSEHKDPKSGRSFYVEKETKRTTWDLAKELGIDDGKSDADREREMAAEELRQRRRAEEEAERRRRPSAQELLASGEWKEVKDYRGLPYFISQRGEACADLELYLKIRYELDIGSGDAKDGTASAAPPSAEARRDAAARIPQMRDWVQFFSQGRESEAAEKRLLDRTTKRELDDARHMVAEAKRGEEALRKQLALRDQEITNLRGLLSMQNKEVQQLQCALFYGMGGNAYSAAVTQSVAPGSSSNNMSSSFSYGDGSAGRPSKLLLPPPPLDVTISRDESHPENVARRIATLERLVFDLQAQNRNLVEQLKGEQQTKHRHADCEVCVEHDPWQRLLSVAHSPSRPTRM